MSVDGMMGKEAQVLLATLSQPVPAKMEEHILQVKDCDNGRIIIAAARSYSRVLCGAQVPSLLQIQELK